MDVKDEEKMEEVEKREAGGTLSFWSGTTRRRRSRMNYTSVVPTYGNTISEGKFL